MNDESMVKSVCMDADDIERAVTRMAHQILEANKGAENLALVGIVTRGDLLAKMLVHKIEEIEGVKVPLGKLDISFYRDDFATHMSPEVHSTDIPFSIDGMTIVLVDDVLYTGRTIRAALDALMDIGRPAAVELARHNAQLAEVDDIVRFEAADARTFHWGGMYGRIVTNPPYGERIMERREAEELYRAFGKAWTKFPETWKLYLLSSHTEFERTFGKTADRKRKLYNGMLKCDLFLYGVK